MKRSFEPLDAEMDAFLCVKVGERWQAMRGMSYKQLTKADSMLGMKMISMGERM